MLIRIVLCLSAGVGIGELYGCAVRPAATAPAPAAPGAPVASSISTPRSSDVQCHTEAVPGDSA
jgi:hypothetical protein